MDKYRPQKFSTRCERNKALEKTLFHFFSGWLVCGKKNESVFCALALKIELKNCALAKKN
jgi:hypothetical protein